MSRGYKQTRPSLLAASLIPCVMFAERRAFPGRERRRRGPGGGRRRDAGGAASLPAGATVQPDARGVPHQPQPAAARRR